LLIWISACAGVWAQTSLQTFEAGNKLYEEGKYSEASAQFAALLNSGQVSAEVWFNQGNALFKSGQLGRAISSYRAAERLAPRDPDIRANLRFAREQVRDPKWRPSRMAETLGRLSLNEWTIICLLPVWSFFLLLATGQWRPSLRPALRSWLWASGALACLCGVGLLFAWTTDYSLQIAPAVVKEATIRHGPLEESKAAFTVQDGAELVVMDTKGDWLQVMTDEQHIGWIKKSQVLQ
jgi:tetratricopeptide (TPR) repeat protein